MTGPAYSFSNDGKPLRIGMLLYPNFTSLDLSGLQLALGLHRQTTLFWKTLEPVCTDSGNSLNPTTTFADCPDDLDILFVPGGFGGSAAMKDDEVVNFLARVGRSTRYVSSVCSGSLLLGMAGLLDGYHAATHWACLEALEATGAIVTGERMVADRNRLIGGGVTSGIDFDLTLLADLRGEQVGRVKQFMVEYNPAPQFDTEDPQAGGPELKAIAIAAMGDINAKTGEVLRSCRKVLTTA